MQEVVCFNCGRIVHISPDAERCSVCGENLHELMHPVYASKYFYDRAAQLAAGSQLRPALQEVERGLGYQLSSELRLLGAILSKRLGDYEQMRAYVAAIPVDDVLRPEGEWLLRSHQMRLREVRSGNKAATGRTAADSFGLGFTDRTLAADAEMPRAIQQVHPGIGAQAPRRPAKKTAAQSSGKPIYGAIVVCLLLLTVASSAVVALNPGLLRFWPDRATAVPVTAPDIAEPVRQPTQEQPLTPTPTTPSAVPADVVQASPTAPAGIQGLAASTPGTAIGIAEGETIDLQSHLQQLNRPDLAQLQVAATLQGTVLSLSGIVPTFEARQALLDAAKSVPGATNVSAVDLLLRLPPTYTVQAGDTLWGISYRLYGDVNKIPVLLDANRDQLPSPESLSVGMVLQVPAPE